MRVIAGKYRGRALTPPSGRAVRPTSDRVRETLFNILCAGNGGFFHGLHVVDVFAGTGAFALEALSRGAFHASVIDKDIRLAARNAHDLGEDDNVTLVQSDIVHLPVFVPNENLPAPALFFLDPPYGQNFLPIALEKLREQNWLTPDALIVMEMEAGETPAWPEGLNLLDKREIGDSELLFANFA